MGGSGSRKPDPKNCERLAIRSRRLSALTCSARARLGRREAHRDQLLHESLRNGRSTGKCRGKADDRFVSTLLASDEEQIVLEHLREHLPALALP
jgi:hypothetical protein